MLPLKSIDIIKNYDRIRSTDMKDKENIYNLRKLKQESLNVM